MSSNAHKISVVIPAHNEAAVIGRCLASMTRGAKPSELEVIVVCNGCSDDTAERARTFGEPVKVIELGQSSKPEALNHGDAAASGFPRFYIDADIVIPFSSIRAVADALVQGDALAAAPRIRVDLSNRNYWVRAYYAVWLRLPYTREKLLGSGVYALSERGHRRLDGFPNIIADDEFVRRRFNDDEKASVRSAWFLITPPTTIRGLVHINIRRQQGLDELRDRDPHGFRDPQDWEQRIAFLALTRYLSLWPAMALYTYVKFATWVGCSWQRLFGRSRTWQRDESSRRPDAELSR